jgi:hypothetical protein
MISTILWFLEWSGYVWSFGLAALAIALWCGALTIQVPFLRATTQQLAMVLLVVAGASAFLRHAYSDGIAAERAKWQAQLAAEEKRRTDVVESVQRAAAAKDEEIARQKAANDKLLEEINHASAANDVLPGLPADGVRRLRAIH